MCCSDGDVGGRVTRHDYVGGEPGKGIGYTFGIGGPCPYAIASIVALGRSKIPTFNGMRGPGALSGGFFMYENVCPRWGKGSAIEIERAVDMSLSG
jgi:hypothetical protein